MSEISPGLQRKFVPRQQFPSSARTERDETWGFKTWRRSCRSQRLLLGPFPRGGHRVATRSPQDRSRPPRDQEAEMVCAVLLVAAKQTI